jgi:glucuronoarabinoxylan endo-1,4-beta-xylanase
MRTRWSSALAVALPLSLVACSSSSKSGSTPSGVVVTLSDVKQPVDGFGASSAFFGGNISDAQADLLFDAKKGIGLSLLRIMVGLPNDTQSDGSEPTTGADPVATVPEIGTAQQAIARGARIWAAAWTPPPIWKTTNNKNESGTGYDSNSLLPEHYQDFADYLANFVQLLSTANPPISLYGLSPTNEPDVSVAWDGTTWSPQQLTTFFSQNLAPTFAQRWPSVKLMAPETVNCLNCDTYVEPLLADPTAASALAIIATHQYGATNPLTYTKPAEVGKPFWQTEWSTENRDGGDTPDPTMTNAITVATQIHNYMTTTQVNSWSFWAIYATWDDFDTDTLRQNPALIQSADGGAPYPFKRAYALGNWSKFVRPGFVRVDATDTPVPGVLIDAYRDDSGHIAVVAVNTTSSSATVPFTAAGGTFGTMTPWVTDPDNDLVAQSPFDATNGFSFALPPTSVVTFVNWDATTLTPGLMITEPPPSDAGGDATQTPTGDTSSLDCADPVTPDNVVSGGVTDFTDWAGATGKWGSRNGLYGAVYAYSGPNGSMVMQNVDTSNKDLHITGFVTAGDYGGAGLAFYDCATVASFSAVQFTVSGSAPGCELDLQIKTFDQQPTSQNPPGGCDSGSCYNFPDYTSIAVPAAMPQMIFAPFTGFSGWSSADATQVVGLQWQFNGSDVGAEGSCPIDVAITGIKFLSASAVEEAGPSAVDAAGNTSVDATTTTGGDGATHAAADASAGGG